MAGASADAAEEDVVFPEMCEFTHYGITYKYWGSGHYESLKGKVSFSKAAYNKQEPIVLNIELTNVGSDTACVCPFGESLLGSFHLNIVYDGIEVFRREMPGCLLGKKVGRRTESLSETDRMPIKEVRCEDVYEEECIKKGKQRNVKIRIRNIADEYYGYDLARGGKYDVAVSLVRKIGVGRGKVEHVSLGKATFAVSTSSSPKQMPTVP